MRVAIAVCLAACAPPSLATRPSPTVIHVHAMRGEQAVDPIAALAGRPDQMATIAPGPVQLELGSEPVQAASGEPLEVVVIDDRGTLVRIGVALEHARFAVWAASAALYAVVVRDVRVDAQDFGGAGFGGQAEVALKRGARVRRLAHRKGATQVRYLGAVEITGWIADDALAKAGAPHDPTGRVPTGRETQMVMPGAVIRAQTRWGSAELAVIAEGYFVDKIAELDDGWIEIGYEDGDVRLHGFVGMHEPPGHVHRAQPGDPTPAAISPTATAASGTCLFASEAGEPIGYIFGDAPVALAPARRAGWWTLTIDSPWGPLAFAARGATETELAACAPPGAVPPPAPATP